MSGFVDGVRLLVDLQRVNAIVREFSGCLDPEAIASRVTHGLVEQFGCAFARIWLVEPNRVMLRLVASSGLYTRTDGSFARVPMGAFKVGKIAQHQIPFLSNQLAEEAWVKDRDWAIAQGIQGFAGYPLAIAGESLGVLAVFSQQPLGSEFLEVLQSLCTTTTVALAAALRYQQEHSQDAFAHPPASGRALGITLSEHLSQSIKSKLPTTQLTLVGTERSLPVAIDNLCLEVAEMLSQLPCIYTRLNYGDDQVSLEAMLTASASIPALTSGDSSAPIRFSVLPPSPLASFSNAPSPVAPLPQSVQFPCLSEVQFAAVCWGGSLQIQEDKQRGIVQMILSLPYRQSGTGISLGIQCRSPLLQIALTRLAYLAGFGVAASTDLALLWLTDDPAIAPTHRPVIWLDVGQGVATPLPSQVKAKLTLTLNPQHLRQAVVAVQEGKSWEMTPIATTPMVAASPSPLSEREQEILTFLTQGLRDRDIASRLIISESTVKFHVNNILAKLKARTRFQALYQALINHWIC